MIQFVPNKILSDSELIAQELIQARQAKNLKISDIAKKLNISAKYLEALEKSDYSVLPEGAYGKSFLREYAIFLGLNYRKIIKIFEEVTKKQEGDKNKDLFSKQVIKKHNLLIVPKIVKNVLILLIVFICVFYLGYYLKLSVYPPELIISEPPDDLVTSENSINIIGETNPEASVIINGKMVPKNDNGIFTEKVNLKNGVNTIVITAKKKYSRENVIKKQILYIPQDNN